MTRESALEMLKRAPRDDARSRVDERMTRWEYTEWVEFFFLKGGPFLEPMPMPYRAELCVYRAVQDRRWPEYEVEHGYVVKESNRS